MDKTKKQNLNSAKSSSRSHSSNCDFIEVLDVNEKKTVLAIPNDLSFSEMKEFVRKKIGKNIILVAYTEELVKQQENLEQNLREAVMPFMTSQKDESETDVMVDNIRKLPIAGLFFQNRRCIKDE